VPSFVLECKIVAHHFFGLENNNNLCISHAFAQANEHTLNTKREGKERIGLLIQPNEALIISSHVGTASQFLFIRHNKKGT
jgi:hypothetical protein